MNITSIQGTFVEVAKSAYKATKEIALWGSHLVKVGITDYLTPLIKTLWASASSGLRTLNGIVKSAPGPTFGIAAALFIAGMAAFKIADHKAYDEDLVSKTAWKALGITAFVGATAITSIGIATLV